VSAGAFYLVMPWLTAREAIGADDAVNIAAGPRDRVFFRQHWSSPHVDGSVTSRVSRNERASVHVPLPQKRAYEIALRIDPVAPDVQKRVTVLLNRRLLAPLLLSWNAERVGSYRLTLPAEWVRAGDNEIELIADTMVPAVAGGARFAWLRPDERVGLRLWYLRVLDPSP
jgi:hypothetical protein